MAYVSIGNATNRSRRASIYACYIITRDAKVRRQVRRCRFFNSDAARTDRPPTALNVLPKPYHSLSEDWAFSCYPENFKEDNVQKKHENKRRNEMRPYAVGNIQRCHRKQNKNKTDWESKIAQFPENMEENLSFGEADPSFNEFERAHVLGFPVLFLFHPTTLFSRGR